MTPRLFHHAAFTLYGQHWRGPIGQVLDVHRKTVWRWETGAYPIPEWVGGRLREVAETRRDAIASLVDQLEEE